MECYERQGDALTSRVKVLEDALRNIAGPQMECQDSGEAHEKCCEIATKALTP
jgi:hypothetical protein